MALAVLAAVLQIRAKLGFAPPSVIFAGKEIIYCSLHLMCESHGLTNDPFIDGAERMMLKVDG